MNKVHLESAAQALSQPWEAVTVARFNGHDVMLAHAKGSYAWHRHDGTDDLFLVLKGRITIEMRDGARQESVHLGEGELFVVPRGVEHRPVAHEDSHFMLIEPGGTGQAGTTLV